MRNLFRSQNCRWGIEIEAPFEIKLYTPYRGILYNIKINNLNIPLSLGNIDRYIFHPMKEKNSCFIITENNVVDSTLTLIKVHRQGGKFYSLMYGFVDKWYPIKILSYNRSIPKEYRIKFASQPWGIEFFMEKMEE